MQDKRIQWHPAFCSAMRLELAENKDELDYYNEYNLSSKPLQMDLLVVRRHGLQELKNTIGKIFQKHNKLFKTLMNQGYLIMKSYKGIYYIKDNGILFPTQIVILNELDKEQHVWLTALTSSMTGSDAHRLVTRTNQLLHKEDKENADSILNVTVRANAEVFYVLRKEAPEMCEALVELMEPVIAEKVEERVKEKIKEREEEITQQVTQQVTQQITRQVSMTMSNNFAVKLLEDNLPTELIMKYTGLSEEEIKKLKESL